MTIWLKIPLKDRIFENITAKITQERKLG